MSGSYGCPARRGGRCRCGSRAGAAPCRAGIQILCSWPFRLRSAVERIHPSTGDPTTHCTVRSNSHEWIRPGPRPNKNTVRSIAFANERRSARLFSANGRCFGAGARPFGATASRETAILWCRGRAVRQRSPGVRGCSS